MASKYSVTISQHAKQDLENIFCYYLNETKEPETATQLADNLETAILNLENFPKAHGFSEIKRLKAKKYRRLIVGNYIVFYKILEPENEVAVIRIIHGMTNYRKSFID